MDDKTKQVKRRKSDTVSEDVIIAIAKAMLEVPECWDDLSENRQSMYREMAKKAIDEFWRLNATSDLNVDRFYEE